MTFTRRQAREWAIQLLASADLNPTDDLSAFLEDFWSQVKSLDPEDGGTSGEEVGRKTKLFAEERFKGVMENCEELDGTIEPYLENWQLYRLGTVERAVLRLGTWELLKTDIPAPVVINEAVDLVNWYASPKSRMIVNGVLDKIAKQLGPERGERIAAADAKNRKKGREPKA